MNTPTLEIEHNLLETEAGGGRKLPPKETIIGYTHDPDDDSKWNELGLENPFNNGEII